MSKLLSRCLQPNLAATSSAESDADRREAAPSRRVTCWPTSLGAFLPTLNVSWIDARCFDTHFPASGLSPSDARRPGAFSLVIEETDLRKVALGDLSDLAASRRRRPRSPFFRRTGLISSLAWQSSAATAASRVRADAKSSSARSVSRCLTSSAFSRTAVIARTMISIACFASVRKTSAVARPACSASTLERAR